MRTLPRAPFAVLAGAALALALLPGTAHAADGSYQTTLNPVNPSSGSGMAMVTIIGTQATVRMSWSGLAEEFDGGPYPHVQHIHIGARGECPGRDADQNGDGVVNVEEGTPAYGAIGATLSLQGDTSPEAALDLQAAPSGGSLEYDRTMQISQETVDAFADGTAVITVHGLDPADLSEEAAAAPSELVPELPLAATSPVLCGALTAMPAGGVATGGGAPAGGLADPLLLGLGGGLLAVAGAAGLLARRQRGVAS